MKLFFSFVVESLQPLSVGYFPKIGAIQRFKVKIIFIFQTLALNRTKHAILSCSRQNFAIKTNIETQCYSSPFNCSSNA